MVFEVASSKVVSFIIVTMASISYCVYFKNYLMVKYFKVKNQKKSIFLSDNVAIFSIHCLYYVILLCPQSPKEFPWLAYDALSAEQLYEEREGYWSGLIKQLKNNRKITMDAALKVTCCTCMLVIVLCCLEDMKINS